MLASSAATSAGANAMNTDPITLELFRNALSTLEVRYEKEHASAKK